jgi:crotonobetainyl-CoA:carnitine CoA-transferase CaiB-like acyl-CoA transferase
MFDSVLSWYIGHGVSALNCGETAHVSDKGLWGTFRTSTQALVITAHRERQWQALCAALDHRDWLADDRFRSARRRAVNIDALRGLVNEVMVTRTSDEWKEVLAQHNVPYAEVRSVGDALSSELATSRNMILKMASPRGEIKLLGNPIKVGDAERTYELPPSYGHDTERVVRDILGYGDDEVREVLALGVHKNPGVQTTGEIVE